METIYCCICGKKIDGFGNNAQPVKEGICCDECNINIVIPKRYEELKKGMEGSNDGKL